MAAHLHPQLQILDNRDVLFKSNKIGQMYLFTAQTLQLILDLDHEVCRGRFDPKSRPIPTGYEELMALWNEDETNQYGLALFETDDVPATATQTVKACREKELFTKLLVAKAEDTLQTKELARKGFEEWEACCGEKAYVAKWAAGMQVFDTAPWERPRKRVWEVSVEEAEEDGDNVPRQRQASRGQGHSFTLMPLRSRELTPDRRRNRSVSLSKSPSRMPSCGGTPLSDQDALADEDAGPVASSSKVPMQDDQYNLDEDTDMDREELTAEKDTTRLD
ncbi:hypothetical protein ONZ51_g12350 [Trametes cubensis]|uniref:Uncharacterized protein n=1 Tax=Trametes cubensis TaxID=1111947 RepID=A0AAD7TGQ7_9APHY|nr:hypothetical protein ONZ51_g12350 [Trametes cubensis]